MYESRPRVPDQFIHRDAMQTAAADSHAAGLAALPLIAKLASHCGSCGW